MQAYVLERKQGPQPNDIKSNDEKNCSAVCIYPAQVSPD